jgi:phosphatidylethanolamine/phosphatidyl-N-methylethanolamine N-methyltransferase
LEKGKLEVASYFLNRFVRSPKHIASVWPSSRFLAAQMFDGLRLGSGDVVIEYGPGTGSFTLEVQRLCNSGVSIRYLGVERDAGMHQFLQRRFPALDFVLADAAKVVELCRLRDLPPAAAIISGLPMIFFDSNALHRLFAATRDCLRPDGVFRTFSYVHSYPSRSAGELRGLMKQYFEEYELSRPVVRNMPPAVTLTGRIPRVVSIAGQHFDSRDASGNQSHPVPWN